VDFIQSCTTTGDWGIHDTMRELGVSNSSTSGTGNRLKPNTSDAESGPSNFANIDPTGFTIKAAVSDINGSGQTYIYIAIRRGPMRAPESGTEVFNTVQFSFDAFTLAGFPVDFLLSKQYSGANSWRALDRMRGTAPPSLDTSSSNAEVLEGYWKIDNNTGVNNVVGGSIPNYQNWMFRRAPEFFDAVAYSGNSVVGRTVPHNLGVAPEMIWVKNRSVSGDNWVVYAGTDSGGTPKKMFLNLTNSWSAAGDFNNTEPTAESFTVASDRTVNNSGENYIAYLFATLAGVSKVGSYTGNGSSQTINCGFTSGARFILIKRTDSTGDWYVWDTARGIVTGNDPHLFLNALVAQVTTDDSIDPEATGFIVNQLAATNINVSSASYIFYAIA
jgi:hypothetical protein